MTKRIGLYVLTLVTMVAAIKSCHNSQTYVERTKPLEAKVEDVIGKEEPEIYYSIGGKRCYIEVDGKPIEESFSQKIPEGGLR